MQRYFMAMLFAFALSACNNNTEEDQHTDSPIITEDSPANNNNISDISGCYLRVMQRDTLAASLTQNGNIISGKLTFDNYQKDGSNGTVTGVVDKDILKLVYRFHSEGMNSISEVYFKITSGGLIHGIGEIMVKGDSAYYVDANTIVYGPEALLTKISCGTLPMKYQ